MRQRPEGPANPECPNDHLAIIECGPIGFIEPIAGIERQQFHFRSVGQICRLVDEQATAAYTSFDGHAPRYHGTAAQHALHSAGAARIVSTRVSAHVSQNCNA